MPPTAPPIRPAFGAAPPGGSPPPTRVIHAAFDPAVPMSEVADTLELALLAAESIYGADRLRLDAAWAVDPDARTVTLDAASRAGRTLALVFLGYARREFGGDAVRVHRVNACSAALGGGR